MFSTQSHPWNGLGFLSAWRSLANQSSHRNIITVHVHACGWTVRGVSKWGSGTFISFCLCHGPELILFNPVAMIRQDTLVKAQKGKHLFSGSGGSSSLCLLLSSPLPIICCVDICYPWQDCGPSRSLLSSPEVPSCIISCGLKLCSMVLYGC